MPGLRDSHRIHRRALNQMIGVLGLHPSQDYDKPLSQSM